MIMLARLADVLALVGCLVGLWRWKSLDAPRRLLVAFLGASAFCGLGQVMLRSMGFGTAWFGNLWDLAALTLFLPVCMKMMRCYFKRLLRPIQGLAIMGWVFFNITLGGIAMPEDYLSMGFQGLLAVAGALLLSQSLDDSAELRHKPAFIVSLVALCMGLFGALVSFAMPHWMELGKEFLIVLMTIYNAGWCGAYLLLAYSLTIRGVDRATDFEQEDRRVQSNSRGTLREWDLPVFHP